ncbi:MAG: Ca2+-dependent phosphoinositide-specific phospholipase C [Chitinophagales bacterium]
MRTLLIICCILSLGLYSVAQGTDGLKLNQIQIIGSHNSYKKLPDERVMKFLLKQSKHLGKELDPRGIDYGHLPFDSQFAGYNIRGLEIDIYNDPKGGLYYKRRINAFVHGVHQKSGVEELKKPGFKVLHIKDVDYQTNYYTFKESLVAVKQWSDAHPKHLPIFINLEPKTKGPGDYSKILRVLGFKRVAPFDAAACDSIDSEIKAVFGNDLNGVLTPDKVRGSYASLNDMVVHNGWPALDACRGQVVFIMIGDAKKEYLQDHENLQNRAVFTYSHPGKADCAFVMIDDALLDSARITETVKQGYIVRTRSDEETRQCRSNNCNMRNAAFNSGAQITSTDYYKPDARFSDFTVQWEQRHVARINPVTCPDRGGQWVDE